MEIFLALAGPAVAAAAAYIAFAQFVTARTKTKVDLFDRRFALFNMLWGYLSAQVLDPDRLPELEAELNHNQHKFLFLFDQAVADYVEKVRSRGVKTMINRRIAANPSTLPDRMQAVQQELSVDIVWYSDQVPGLAGRFGRFLLIEEWDGVPESVRHRLKRTEALLLPKLNGDPAPATLPQPASSSH
ncbi:hypothetical protein ACO2Q9_02580 [Variovorax sp. VNK109]|uniref:hypothetical protein n=1 Tax=Variovorax sp. VNK109 TaxID=3400919 RepID=UPI003C0F4413